MELGKNEMKIPFQKLKWKNPYTFWGVRVSLQGVRSREIYQINELYRLLDKEEEGIRVKIGR